ncbi:hypothetical protein CEP52_015441 [Fusarium oligoseptatum]|uniref:Major facilitator superfamily (MFS) profile domain-containing protein n=1 Tax=Fusarium oligoseptatum TaxID=2604345 RepID=A0A428SDA6_9HYPO|nr:hypothetical protein CEP52_015441 [Fusarium oligoseptatum]
MPGHALSQDETQKGYSLEELSIIDQREYKDACSDERPGGLPEWKWKAAVLIFIVTGACSGYDVSNVANIQPRLYDAFGNIELLPWIALSYSLANFAVLSFARKIAYCFDLKWVYLVHLVIFMAGTAIGGASNDIQTMIVARVIMGWGGSVCQQINFSYVAILAKPAETAGLFGILSAMWAVGLVVGGPIGSAFAENSHTTWRWASLATANVPAWRRLVGIDPIGVVFNMIVPVLFALATTFSGPIWDWGSAASTAVWVVFAVALVSWISQQYFCTFTSPEERAIPMHMFSKLKLLPIWVATGCAGAAYAVTLYYTPLFYAFARGHGAIQQTVRMLPFIIVFIFVVLFTGVLLTMIGRYKIIYLCASTITLAASIAMATTMNDRVSEALVMGIEAVIGIGLGMQFQHGLGISNVINKTERDRVDSTVICNMVQMGSIAITLSIAGCVFQNVGFNLLSSAVGQKEYSEEDIREALAGVSSVVWQTKDRQVVERGIAAVTEVLSREFYIVVASSVVCLICAICMSSEKLDYGKKKY